MRQPDFRKNIIPFAGLLVLVGGVGVLAVVTAPLLESPQNPAAVSAAEVATLTNKERSEKDIPALQRNSLLDQAAQMKAQDMAANGYYAHVSPDGVTPMHWVGKAGYKYLIIGENLVVNRTDAEQVVDAFMGSPGHRANILRTDFTEIGIGVANGVYKGKDATFTVQIFAAPYPQQAAPKKEVPKVAVKPVSTPVKASAPAKPVAPVSVPRPAAATTMTAKTATTSRPSDALQKEVTRLISPILSSIQNASTSSSTVATTTPLERPSFSLNTSVPIELTGVSQLEAETLPVPIGSSWTMEVRVFLNALVQKTRSLFP
ncbi:MAG: CAP domain-containing protein [Patescibacteria group bacterium]